MLRSLLPALLVVSSGCTLHHARLDASRDLVITRSGDGLCGPIGIRRSSLGARWGEYVRVSVTSPAVVTGEARLHVDGRAYPLQQFTTAPTLDVSMQVADQQSTVVPAVLPLPTQTIVLDAAWTNERLDIPAALEAGHVIDITLAGLTTPQGNCSNVVFTVEQGVFRPTVDERLWVAELIRRGGPELQAWMAAEELRKEEIRRAHYAEADRRRVEWLAQLEVRREQVRIETAARVEAERVEVALRIEAAREQVAMRAEAERVQVAAKVEADRVEVERREAVRQAHYADYERRRVARSEGTVNVVAVAQAPVAPAPKRTLVCRAPVSSGRVFSGVASYAPVSSVPVVVADESCEEVVEPASTVVAASMKPTVVNTAETRGNATVVNTVESRTATSVDATVVNTAEPTAASVTTTYDTGASVTLQGSAVTTQTVTAAPAMDVESYPEWSTPETFTTARVAVTTERVAPPQPPAPPPAPVRVVDATPALVLFNIFGAVLNAAVRAQPQPQHRAVPVASGPVHVARPVAPPPPVATARPGVQPPPPPAPR
ncbi:MAG: hypothetical protein Q8S33_11225 [Myxococcales bacterium]|nr:hypothetical protein [Myxococcales bacterium]